MPPTSRQGLWSSGCAEATRDSGQYCRPCCVCGSCSLRVEILHMISSSLAYDLITGRTYAQQVTQPELVGFLWFGNRITKVCCNWLPTFIWWNTGTLVWDRASRLLTYPAPYPPSWLFPLILADSLPLSFKHSSQGSNLKTVCKLHSTAELEEEGACFSDCQAVRDRCWTIWVLSFFTMERSWSRGFGGIYLAITHTR